MRIDAHRSETEGWRIDRLKKTLSTFCQIYGISSQQAELLIDRINDYRGLLTVTWHECAPTEEQKRAWSIAWKLSGEDPLAVKHNDLGPV
jgi:hypothetical protein